MTRRSSRCNGSRPLADELQSSSGLQLVIRSWPDLASPDCATRSRPPSPRCQTQTALHALPSNGAGASRLHPINPPLDHWKHQAERHANTDHRIPSSHDDRIHARPTGADAPFCICGCDNRRFRVPAALSSVCARQSAIDRGLSRTNPGPSVPLNEFESCAQSPAFGAPRGTPYRSPKTGRCWPLTVGRVRSEVCAKRPTWTADQRQHLGRPFITCGLSSAGLVIPYFIPSMGATVGDGQKRSATATPGSEPVRDCRGRSETALKRFLIRRFWVRNPGGARRSTRSEATLINQLRVYRMR